MGFALKSTSLPRGMRPFQSASLRRSRYGSTGGFDDGSTLRPLCVEQAGPGPGSTVRQAFSHRDEHRRFPLRGTARAGPVASTGSHASRTPSATPSGPSVRPTVREIPAVDRTVLTSAVPTGAHRPSASSATTSSSFATPHTSYPASGPDTSHPSRNLQTDSASARAQPISSDNGTTINAGRAGSTTHTATAAATAAGSGGPTGGSAGGGPGDLRLELWLSLLQATAAQLSSAGAAAAAAASGAATRLQRLSSPPPPAFPAGPPGDSTLSLLSDPLAFLTAATARYGNVVGLVLGGERVVLVSGRDEARAVLVEQAGSVYVKEGTAFFPGSSLAGNGLLVSDGPVWQRQRRLANPAFRRAAVEAYGAAMVAATADMLDHTWGAGGSRDVYADFNELTLQVTLEALFGIGAEERRQQQRQQQQLDGRAGAQGGVSPPAPSTPSSSASASASSSASSEEAQRIVGAVEKAFTFFTQRAATGFVIPEWLPTWDNLEFAAAVQQLDRVVYGMIARRRGELAAAHGSVAAAAAAASAAAAAGAATNNSIPSDLLTSLLLSRDEDGSGMSDRALRDELMTLLVAGQETSAILLGWAAALLAAHPEVQQRAAAEAAEACGGEGVPTPASVRRMPYLESVVLETLRLYSPAYMVGRCARVDASLGPYRLPAGTTVLVSPYVMHRDPAAWDQPQEFRPQRWHELQGRDGYAGSMGLMSNLGPNGSYLPFGGGPRNCIGTGFAMMEAMLVLASLLLRYRLELPAPQQRQPPAQPPQQSGAGHLPPGFPRPKPLLTLRPEAVVLRIVPR